MQAVNQDLTAKAFRVFDHYLTGQTDRPIAVAVSGGGDSVALLLLLKAWGRRPLEVFHVDHGINPLSGHWSDFVSTLCKGLGLPFTALKWEGEKPKTGLSAKARHARHSLIYEAMRLRGLNLLCLGHTDDDVAEAFGMRNQGSNVTAPQIWTPAPLWPQGRGIFCLRPLLSMRREDLRQFLRDCGQDWIDDPSNSSGQNLRSRIRLAQEFSNITIQDEALSLDAVNWNTLFHDPEDWAKLGYFRIDRDALAGLVRAYQRKILAASLVCAGGGDRLPRGAQIEAILDDNRATMLCGAKIWFDARLIHICRAEHDRRRVSWLDSEVIDGRFSYDGLDIDHIVPLHGHMSKLIASQKDYVLALPPSVRAALPVARINNNEKVCLAHKPLREFDYIDFFVTYWARWRLRAALGLMATEALIAPDMEQVLR